ncbi:hypothetical protein PG984_013932 [Apiospora sp. TS-2023a]
MNTVDLQISPERLGLVRGVANPPGTLEECNRLLEYNHEAHHVFFRERAGMNHVTHSLLTCFALGIGVEELRKRYDDEAVNQRAMPPLDADLLGRLDEPEVFLQSMFNKAQYNTFLHFFRNKIAAAGGWKKVVHDYVFSRTDVAERMLSSLFDGLYHPLIHLGLAIEFELPGLVAEALAQTATNDDCNLHGLFAKCEEEAAATTHNDQGPSPSMLQLLKTARETEELRTAPRWEDRFQMLRNGVVDSRGSAAFARLAGSFRVRPDEDEIEFRTAEMISVVAYMCGAAQRAGRPPKIDFFWMHSVTSSVFLTNRARLLTRKVYTDLGWYVVAGSAELDREHLAGYSSPESDGMSWEDVFAAVTKEHDDGHAAKFIRAVKNGEQVCKQYEGTKLVESLPVTGDMWLKLARMCQDTTKNMTRDVKWVRFTGHDEAWEGPDAAWMRPDLLTK